jgi:hypothetical protein
MKATTAVNCNILRFHHGCTFRIPRKRSAVSDKIEENCRKYALQISGERLQKRHPARPGSLESTRAKAADLKAQADLLARGQRLARCQANRSRWFSSRASEAYVIRYGWDVVPGARS